MYDKEGKVIDKREMLRVKVKSLAEEARIIRHEERRTHGVLRNSLHEHRVTTLRNAARQTHLAYGFIKGRTYEQMESSHKKGVPAYLFDWAPVWKMIRMYGNEEQRKLASAVMACGNLRMDSKEVQKLLSPASSEVEHRALNPVV